MFCMYNYVLWYLFICLNTFMQPNIVSSLTQFDFVGKQIKVKMTIIILIASSWVVACKPFPLCIGSGDCECCEDPHWVLPEQPRCSACTSPRGRCDTGCCRESRYSATSFYLDPGIQINLNTHIFLFTGQMRIPRSLISIFIFTPIIWIAVIHI